MPRSATAHAAVRAASIAASVQQSPTVRPPARPPKSVDDDPRRATAGDGSEEGSADRIDEVDPAADVALVEDDRAVDEESPGKSGGAVDDDVLEDAGAAPRDTDTDTDVDTDTDRDAEGDASPSDARPTADGVAGEGAHAEEDVPVEEEPVEEDAVAEESDERREDDHAGLEVLEDDAEATTPTAPDEEPDPEPERTDEGADRRDGRESTAVGDDEPGVPAATADSLADGGPATTSDTGVLSVEGLTKRFDGAAAVDGVSISVAAGSIFGIVGPNGAGKTTTLSMITGLLRPDEGRVLVHGADVWADPVRAKREMGVLPDRLRLFDRLTGAQLLYYSGTLRGLDRATVKSRSVDLAAAFGLEEALGRLVTDYSAGMTKKIAIAAALIHSPRLLILDEPFEAVDPVSAANVTEILQRYARAGGTVVMSSHSMDLIQRVCDSVSIIVRGRVLASGTMDEVRAGGTLEDRFVELAGGRKAAEGMEWLHSFSA